MMVRFVRLLTLWNVVCSASLGVIIGLAVAMDLSVGGGAPLDFPAFVFSWAWLGGTPFVVAAALLLNRKSKWRAGTAINLSVGVLWIASVVYVFLMPCPSIWQNQLDSEAKETEIKSGQETSALTEFWKRYRISNAGAAFEYCFPTSIAALVVEISKAPCHGTSRNPNGTRC
jgi:hypothetical protein